MDNIEIERKFALKDFPENLRIEEVIDIEQIYIYRDKNTMIRIRKIKIRDSAE